MTSVEASGSTSSLDDDPDETTNHRVRAHSGTDHLTSGDMQVIVSTFHSTKMPIFVTCC